MSESGASARSPIPIGEVASPPFAKVPEPQTLFRTRAQRFAVLSFGHKLEPYLRFMAGLAEAQHRVQDGLPEVEVPDAEILARAKEHAMPPLDRNGFKPDPVFETTFDRLLELAPQIEMPEAARQALGRVIAMDAAGRDALVGGVLADGPMADAFAEHAFTAAACQVHFARLAAKLNAEKLVPVGDGVCPACGGAPVSSMVVGWKGAHNTRFCSCSLCATLWHVVRIKCTICGSTKGIAYQEIENGPDANLVRAETCDECHSYVKILQLVASPELDPVADDVATLALDMLMREAGEYKRAAVNPYLLGY